MARKDRKNRKGSNTATANPGAVAVTPGATSPDFYETKQRDGKRRPTDDSHRDSSGGSTLYDEKQRIAAGTNRKKHYASSSSGPEELGATPMPGIPNDKKVKGVAGNEDPNNIQLSTSVDGSMAESLNASTTSADAGITQMPGYDRGTARSEMHLVQATTVPEDDDADDRQQLPVTYASETVDVEKQEKQQQKKQRRLIIIFVVVLIAVVGIVLGVMAAMGVFEGDSGTPAPTLSPTFSADQGLEDFLASMSLDEGAAMRDSSTPQGQALAWLQDPTSNPLVGENVDTLTRYVLATFYFALGGSSWQNTDGWLTASSVCDWYTSGATPCNGGVLTDIDLNRNDLKGALPGNEIAMLAPQLEVLDVSYNQLTGTIPTALGLLTNLQIFFIDGNQFEGTVPSELGGLVSMQKIYLNGNDLEGTVPEDLCALEIKIFWADCKELNCTPCCTKCCDEQGANCTTA